jgi:hypothetical protein
MSMKRLREERGNVMVITMFLLSAMMMLGLASKSIVDTESSQSGKERVRESTFNLTEGVLSSETYALGRIGTGSATNQFPNKCTPGSTSSLCPSTAELSRAFDGASQKDFAAGTDWEISVRDNQDPTTTTSLYYNPALTGSNCAAGTAAANRIYCYDQNDDKQLWVRAASTVRNRTRTIVALVKTEPKSVNIPRYAILSGGFSTTNNGNKVIVDAGTDSLGVAVRCTQVPPDTNNPCLGYDPNKGQLSPAGKYTTGYPNQPAVGDDDLGALADKAKANNTYYTSCPANTSGAVVYIALAVSANCVVGQSNTAAVPGLLIMEKGTLSMGANDEYYGIIYMMNKQNSSGDVFSLQGTSAVFGGVLVDGLGKVSAGSSGTNIKFLSTAFDLVQTTGTAGVVQNTWRELPAD